jgi:hypothetical protein
MRDYLAAPAARHEPVEMERLSRIGGRRSGARDLPVRPAAVRPNALAPKGGPKRDLHDPDWVIAVAVIALAAIGILMVYSASAIDSYANSRNTFQMVMPQILAGLAGLATMIVLARLDYRYLRKVSLIMAVGSLVLLVAV